MRHNIYPNLDANQLSATPLNDQQQFRQNKINEVEDYFIAEIKERKLMSKCLANALIRLIILINL